MHGARLLKRKLKKRTGEPQGIVPIVLYQEDNEAHATSFIATAYYKTCV